MEDKPIVRHNDDVSLASVDNAENASIQVLLGPDDGMPNFYTRLFTLEPGARIPSHRHDTIEHEQVVVEGELTLILEDGEKTVKAGDVVYLPANQFHGYENRSAAPAKFFCMIPAGAYDTEWA